MDSQTFDVVVIGAGQAGLAAGHFLKDAGVDFTILEKSDRVGDVWRNRWDSLRLFTPAKYCALPGRAYPAPDTSRPGREEFADYLEGYAREFDLPVQTGIHVHSVRRAAPGFELQGSEGTLFALNVIATPGPNSVANVPPVSREIGGGITQLHSSDYRSPASIPPGGVLVVGAGTSGAEIALELAKDHARKVYLSGRPTAHIPDAVFRYAAPLHWRVVNSVLTLDTRPGRKAAQNFHRRGAPLISISIKDVERAGVVRLPRLQGAADVPADVRTIIWASGYRPAFDWIEGLPLDADGWPATSRGVVQELPGLYFVGMPFQYALTSGLVGGVGRDAKYVVEYMMAHRESPDRHSGQSQTT